MIYLMSPLLTYHVNMISIVAEEIEVTVGNLLGTFSKMQNAQGRHLKIASSVVSQTLCPVTKSKSITQAEKSRLSNSENSTILASWSRSSNSWGVIGLASPIGPVTTSALGERVVEESNIESSLRAIAFEACTQKM